MGYGAVSLLMGAESLLAKSDSALEPIYLLKYMQLILNKEILPIWDFIIEMLIYNIVFHRLRDRNAKNQIKNH